jgi:hypothetical protein
MPQFRPKRAAIYEGAMPCQGYFYEHHAPRATRDTLASIRMVTHRDVDRAGCERALRTLRELVAAARTLRVGCIQGFFFT